MAKKKEKKKEQEPKGELKEKLGEKPYGPLDYTELELAQLRAKKDKTLYQEVMKARREINREKKKANDTRIRISGVELDILAKNDPKKYAELVEKLAEQRKHDLHVRLGSSTGYAADTERAWRLEIKAIKDGGWHPNTPIMGPWRAPKRRSVYDNIVS